MFNNEILNIALEFIGANTVCFTILKVFLEMSKTKKKRHVKKNSTPFIDYYAEQGIHKKVA